MVNKQMKFKPLIFLFFLLSCQEDSYYNNRFSNMTDYDILPNTKTPVYNIQVDTSGQQVDLSEIDVRLAKLQECLGYKLDYSHVVIKVAPNWYVSPCTGAQLFPCDIPKESCSMKGITEEQLKKCPCACRVAVQDHDNIVTTPDLILLTTGFIRVILGIDPWYSEEIIPCL